MKNESLEIPSNLESLSVASDFFVIRGWVACIKEPEASIEIFLRRIDSGETLAIHAFRHPRLDVSDYLGLPSSVKPGFHAVISIADISNEEKSTRYSLQARVKLNDGEIHDSIISPSLTLDEQGLTDFDNPPGKDSPLLHQMLSLGRRFLFGRLGSRTMGLRAGGHGNLSMLISDQAGAELAVTDSHGRTAVLSEIAANINSASQNQGHIVIFDHNFGGGANQFSDTLISDFTDSGNIVSRIYIDLDFSLYAFDIHFESRVFRFSTKSWNEIELFIKKFPIFAVFINNMYGWPNLESILLMIVRNKSCGNIKHIEFFAHDHLPVCPSLFLLNQHNVFCGVPDSLAVCKKCLRQNEGEFKIFFNEQNVDSWRKTWELLFVNADLIRFFSNSTLRSYKRAFPSLESNNGVLVQSHDQNLTFNDPLPDRVSDNTATKTAETRSSICRIAVFGHINLHKGSGIISAFSDYAAREHLAVEFHVFGSLNGIHHLRKKNLIVHGPYDRAEMPALWRKHNLTFGFVPSICPETFSFVTQELIAMQVPIIAFDLGAQGEAVSKYERGVVLPSPAECPPLDSFVAFLENGANHFRTRSA